MTALQAAYIGNCIIAGFIGATSVLFPETAESMIFSQYYSAATVRMAGLGWLAFAALSAMGIRKPDKFAWLLAVQLAAMILWMCIVSIPAMKNGRPYPVRISILCIIWLFYIPFVIPWERWANKTK